MTKRKVRYSFALLLVFLWITAIAPEAMAFEEHAGWTIDIARELLAEGWEDVQSETAAPVVGYAIHFVELGRDVAWRMGFGFDLDTGEEGPGLWRIAEQNLQVQALLDVQFHFSPNLHYELGHAVRSTSHDSWLITTSGKPLEVDISSTRIPASSSEHKEEGLKITILPKNVDHERGLVESEITLIYETLGGPAVHLQTTAWVGAISDRPLAVVSREIHVGRNTEYQYFAMYVAGTVIPDELIPKDASFIPMGTILGMQKVMEDVPERRLAELTLAGSYADGNWGVMVDGFLPLGQHLGVYGELQTLPELVYVIGVEGSINNEFCLVAELGDISDDGFALRLGVRDELHLGENIKVSATLLPLRFTLEGPEEKFVFNWRIYAEVLLEDYSLWYGAHNNLGQVTHNLGASVFRSKPVEARVSWAWNELYGSVIAAGVRLKF